ARKVASRRVGTVRCGARRIFSWRCRYTVNARRACDSEQKPTRDSGAPESIVQLRAQNFRRFPNRLRTFLRTFPLRALTSTVLLSPAIALHPFTFVEELQIRYYLLKRYRSTFGVFPRLNPPVSFNERILHRLIYDRDPRLRIVSDKLAVRGFIEE